MAAWWKVTHGSVMSHDASVIVLPGRRSRMHTGVGRGNDGQQIVARAASAARIGVNLCSVWNILRRR